MSLLESCVHTSWRSELQALLAPYAFTIDLFLTSESDTFDGVADILPLSACSIFGAFQHCDFADTKVVILGEPYTDPHLNTGLAYSTPPLHARAPPATSNILAQVTREYGKARGSPDLTSWARQGVLLLNMPLTVREACKRSAHDQVWEPFVTRVLQAVSTRACEAGVVFMLWGKQAQSMAPHISHAGGNNLVLCAAHPACGRMFDGCNHFSKANNYLVACGRAPIKWWA